MLYVYLGDHPDSVYDVNAHFDATRKPEWFDDPIVKQMILDIDKSEVVGPNLIISTVFGPIPPEYLSGGVKALIIMLKQPELIVNANNCGNNCSTWIQRIGDMHDVTIALEYFMEWYEDEHPVNFTIANDGTVVHSRDEFGLKALQYLILDGEELE